MGKPEEKVEQELVKQCRQRRWLCWKFTSPGLRGVPDRIVIAPATVAFVECKSDVGVLRKQQLLRIQEIMSRNIDTYVVHTKEEVSEVINKIETNSRLNTLWQNSLKSQTFQEKT